MTRAADDDIRRLGHEVGPEMRWKADLCILHGEPRHMPHIFHRPPWLRKRCVVGYVVWVHLELPPQLAAGLELLDEVWTRSGFCRQVLSRHHDNGHVIPHVVEPRISAQAIGQAADAIGHADEPDAFRFYAIARPDHAHKNVPAALATFEGLESTRPLRFVVEPVPGLEAPSDPPDGGIAIDGDWPTARILDLHALCHGYVSPHRSEG